MSRPTQGLKSELRIRDYHPLWYDFPIVSTFLNLSHWPGPFSLATTNGVSFDVLSYRYLDVSVPCVCFIHPILFRCRYLFSKVGCPIRRSTDQRVFAPPRSLSQRITSFIACACQGIHQMPLRHLIVLIANIHSIFSIKTLHVITRKAFVICLLICLSTSLCPVQDKAQNKQ